ncbi:peptidase U32 family protein [Pelobacter seleniigenes]|uniref:peptidase U32 family protein n=1 Tax=Pelobacter seleniigenes TaxID=407188 RepID=UPI0004A6D3E3|nr:U32 family peptidase C-terminal domain-containing protein [Pelobacter seleniigenes]
MSKAIRDYPELLMPAGDMEKLKTAIRFGADAVYLGTSAFGLRAHAGNFSIAQLREARALTRQAGVALYLTLNASLRPEELICLEELLEELRPLELDAYIIADPGVLLSVQKVDPGRAIHLSTQVNSCNPQAAEFWRRNGVSRLNLARELTLADIRSFAGQTALELECFVHGAMCVAHSGRCLLSTALLGRSANRGDCAQPCRWEYSLLEETRPGQHFAIEEDARGTYLMNSRDLCLVEQLPELIAAGIDSFKVEGRMKSLYYVATTARVYRDAIDRLVRDPRDIDPRWRSELEKVSHRPYDTGFLFGHEDAKIHAADTHYIRTHDFVGFVREDEQGLWVEGRNRFLQGDELELLGPQMRQQTFRAELIRSRDGAVLPAGQPNSQLLLELPSWAEPGDLIRRQRPE